MRIELIVQAADNAITGKGLVVLDKVVGDPFLVEGLFVI
jgi:hypothetical protein